MKVDRFVSGVAAGAMLGASIALGLTAVAQTPPRPPVPVEDLHRFAEIFSAVKTNYVDPVVDKKLIDNCIGGLVKGLDDRSQYYDAEALRGPAPGVGGIGAEVGVDGGVVKIVSPIENSPAARAGLQAGDSIVRVDGTPVEKRPLSDVVKMLRGKPGTEVRLGVLRQGAPDLPEIAVRRELIRVQSVRATMREGGIGLVRISDLQEFTAREVAERLRVLYAGADRPRAIVLDLRNNPGGVLNGAVAVAAVFLERDAPIGRTDGRIEDARRAYRAAPQDFLRGMQDDFTAALPPEARTAPLAVLVNRGTASGAEIIAGALQDAKRAVIVGEKTYGVGTIQTVLPTAENTALKLTTARWYRPSGGTIQGVGIAPDVPAEGPQFPGLSDPVLAAAIAALKL